MTPHQSVARDAALPRAPRGPSGRRCRPRRRERARARPESARQQSSTGAAPAPPAAAPLRPRPPVPAHLGGRDVHHTCRPPLLPQLSLLDLPLPLPGAGARALSLGGQLLLALGGARCGGGLGPAAPGERRRRLLGGGAAAQGGAGEADAVQRPAGGGRRALRGQATVVVQLGGGATPRRTGLPARCARGRRCLLRPHLLPLGFPFLQKVRGATPGAAVAASRHVPGGLDGESAPPAPLTPPAPRRLCCRPERRGPGGSGGRDEGGRVGGGERGSEKHKHPGEKQRGDVSRPAALPIPVPPPRELPGKPPAPGDESPSPPALERSAPTARNAAPGPGAAPLSPWGSPHPSAGAARQYPPSPPPARPLRPRRPRSAVPRPGPSGTIPRSRCHPPAARLPARGAAFPRAAGRGERGQRSPPARRGRGSGTAPRRRHQVSGTASRRPGRSGAAPSLPELPPLSPSRRGHSRSQGGNCRDGPDNGVRAGRPRPARCVPRPDRPGCRPAAVPRHLPRAAPARERTRTSALPTSGRDGEGMPGPGQRRPRPHSASPAALTDGGRGLPEPRQEGPEKAVWCHTPPRGLPQTRSAPAAKARPKGPDVRPPLAGQVPGSALGRGGSRRRRPLSPPASPEPRAEPAPSAAASLPSGRGRDGTGRERPLGLRARGRRGTVGKSPRSAAPAAAE